MYLKNMSSRDIISYVRKQTGKLITISPKSKKSIIKKAAELLREKIAKESDGPILNHAHATTVTKYYPKKKSEEIKRILRAMENCIKDLLKIL